jgi:pyruvate, orthophosphate dikinase
LREGDLITLDGNDGSIYAGAARTEVVQDAVLLQRLARLRGQA